MAAGALFSALLRRSRAPTAGALLASPRLFASHASTSEGLTAEEEQQPAAPDDDLRSRIFRLRFPKRSATAALEKWVAEGRAITAPELRRLACDLRRSQRYKHALEIITWMECLGSFTLSALDHATRLDLITKVHNIAEAEVYFENLTSSTSRKAASFPLLHHHVKERNMEKAEAFMVRLQNFGLAVNPHLFNEMMKLYIAAGQFEKVFVVIRLMKQGKIPLNVLSYNLWMNACCEVSGVASVELVQREMVNDNNVELGWSTYATLANVYTKSGLFDKAITALRMAEEKLSVRNRLAYSFIMTNYAALRDRDGVVRIWESSKRVPGRISCVNYMCIMSCLLKVGDIGEAECVFRTWETQCRKYDIRVSNVLLGAYVRNGWIDKAESLHFHTLERGGSPNYKTWEILMEGWVKTNQMDKAVEAMKTAFSLLKHCNWRPSSEIVMAISDYFEKKGSVEDSKRYMKVLKQLNLTSLPLYKSFLRVHINANKAAPNILKMMARDKIEIDEEASDLIQNASGISCADA